MEFQRVHLRTLKKYFGNDPWRTIPKNFEINEGCISKTNKETKKQTNINSNCITYNNLE